MIPNFDIYDRSERPAVVLCNPNKAEIYSLDMCYNLIYTPRFNALSEVSFTIPGNINGNDIEAFDYVLNKRLIFLKDIGYFNIVDVDEDKDGITNLKNVTCYSLESKSINKRLVGFNGTYKFYDPITPEGTLLQEMIDRIPSWSVGSVDAVLWDKYRTFNVDDNSIYNFLMEDVSQAYECVFVFDTINNEVSAYHIDTATTETDIYISYDNLMKSGSLKVKDEEITTALRVYGAGELDIRTVNPLGGSIIYNFTYYKTTDWMDSGLISAIDSWEALISSSQTPYANLLTELKNYNISLVDSETELVELQNEYLALEGVQKARIEADLDYSDLNPLLAAKQAEIDSKESEISLTESNITITTADLTTINTLLSFENNFTDEQYETLTEFIFENVYQNENFVQTDIMTPAEIQDVSQELYDQGENVLEKLSSPRYEFEIESVNFLFLKDFEKFHDDFALGANVTIDFGDGTITESTILEVSIDYDKPDDFSMCVSNKLRLSNENFTFSDLIGKTIKTGNSVSFGRLNWESWNDNYKDDVSTFITSALDATTNNIINAENQEILINQNGLRGRQSIGSGLYSDKQVWLTSSILAFTKDNWETASAALGNIEVDGVDQYGLVADFVVGRLLAGNQLSITNEGNNFLLDASGAYLTDATLFLQTSNNKNRISINPTDGIKIEANPSGTWDTQFSVDSSGNVIFAGDLSGASGTFSGTIEANDGLIGGWTINSNGISDAYGNYINSNGNVKLGSLLISGSTSTFDGNIYANKIYGQVVDSQIASGVGASKITYGNMSGHRVYGGSINGGAGGVNFDGSSGRLNVNGGSVWVNGGSLAYITSGDLIYNVAPRFTVQAGQVDFSSVSSFAINLRYGSTNDVALSYYGAGYHITKVLQFYKGIYTGWYYA